VRGEVVLSVPDIRQGDTFDCGRACAKAVCLWWDVPFRGGPTCGEFDGTHPATMDGFFRVAGLSVLSGNMALEDLRHHVRLGRPVCCAVAGHWVVVGGVERGKVHYHDPQEGPCKKKAPEFLTWWRDQDRFGTPYQQFGIATWH
jgi:hypothetical protein